MPDEDEELCNFKQKKSGRFVFNWKPIQGDIIWERVHSRPLNVWILSVGVFLLISILLNIEFEFNVPNVLSTTVSYGIYLIVGMFFSLIVSPLTLVNAPGRKRFDWRVGMLAFYALGSIGVMSYEYGTDLKGHSVFAYAIWAVGLYACLLLLKNVIYDFLSDTKESHIDIAQRRNYKYVRRLLKRKLAVTATPSPTSPAASSHRTDINPPTHPTIPLHHHETNQFSHELPLRLHPLFRTEGSSIIKVTPTIETASADILVLPETPPFVNHDVNHSHSDAGITSISPDATASSYEQSQQRTPRRDVSQERTLSEFFREMSFRDIWKDIWYYTPIIMRLGLLLGMLGIVLAAVAAVGSLQIQTSWDYIYNWYLDQVSGINDYTAAAADFQSSVTVSPPPVSPPFPPLPPFFCITRVI